MPATDAPPSYTWAQKKQALMRHLRPYKRLLSVLSAAAVVAAAANGIVPYVMGRFFDALITPSIIDLGVLGAYPAWAVLVVCWAVIQLIANSVSFLIDRKQRRLTTEFEANVQAQAFAHLLTLPISFHKKHRSGEIADNVNKAAWMLNGSINTMLSIAPQFLTIVIGVIISFTIYPRLALVLLGGVAAYCVVLVRILPSTAQYQSEGFRVWNRVVGDAQDAYTNVATVKQAGAEEYEKDKILKGFYERAIPLWYRMERAWSNLNFSQRIIVTLTQAVILVYSVFLISQGAITIGDLIAFNSYAGMIIGPFVSLGHQWQTLQNGLVAITRAEVVFGAASESYEPAGAVALPQLNGEVVFDDVYFAYEEGQPETLRGVSFTAKPGEVIAFVGETGVGKSTSTELISGYYFANKGAVRIDGHDITRVNLKNLRRHIAIVPQEVVLFNSTIKENIRYARPEATDAEIEAVAKKAHADAFIEKFPLKYEQEVGERGIKLSVGQKQRIAIARAMLRDPHILILDEPTSALDAETEKYITTSFEELMKGRTTFIVAHRLSTVRKADKIVVLKDGKVAETGRHDELLLIPNGVYKHLYELQIGLHE